MLATTFLALFLASDVRAESTSNEHHEREPDDPFRVQALAGGVHALYGRGGNVGFFAGPDAALVVDSQFKDLAPGIIEKIRSTTGKPIKFLLNTHHHGDHVGGNAAFRPIAVIVAHDNVRRRMFASPAEILKTYPARAEAARKAGNADGARQFEEQIEWAKTVKVEEIPAPIVTYANELRIHLGDETIHLWHTPPAHTDGDSVVFFEKAGVLHMGDLLFNKIIPFIDVRGGGTPRGYLAALDHVLGRMPAGASVIPGHGEVTDRAGIEAFRKYVADLVDLAQKARAAGSSKEQFLKEADLPAYRAYSGYEARFKVNAEAAWDELP